MGIAEVGLHPPQAEHDVAVAGARDILRREERLVQRDPEAALQEDGEVALAADRLQQLEILRVARADLQHHARRVARLAQRRADLVQVLVASDFHRDHADAVLARELEDVRQAALAVALERVGAGARLVRAHARAHLARGLQRLEGLLDVFAGVDGVEARDHVEAVLVEVDALVAEADRLLAALPAPEDPELVGLAHWGVMRAKGFGNADERR